MVYTLPSLKLIKFVNHHLNTEWKLSWHQLFDDKNFTKWYLINFVHWVGTAPFVLWTSKLNSCIKRIQNKYKIDSIKKTVRVDYHKKRYFANEEQIIWWPFVKLSMFRKYHKECLLVSWHCVLNVIFLIKNV